MAEGFIDRSKVKTAQELIQRIDEYFRMDRKHTVTGLALYLGCKDKSEIRKLKEDPEFGDIIKKASLQVESEYEEMLSDKGRNPGGAIFALKNFGWIDNPNNALNLNFIGQPKQILDAQQDALDMLRNGSLELDIGSNDEEFINLDAN